MAAMTTALTEFSSFGDSYTSTISGHTVSKPRLVVERRKVPSGSQTVYEYSCNVVYATTDADGNILNNKYTFQVIHRGPVGGTTTDRDAALVVFRDMIAGDEFANSVSTQEWL